MEIPVTLGVLQGLTVLVAVLMGFNRLGHFSLKFLSPDRKYDPGISTAAGIAVYNVLAGVLELSCTSSSLLFASLIVAGVVAALLTLPFSSAGRDIVHQSGLSLCLVLLFTILMGLFLVNAAHWDYNFIDDRAGYLVFARRILEEGCIGRDLFHYRRMESGLSGGGAYNYALLQSILDVNQTRLADVGVGSACLAMMVYYHAKELRLPPAKQALALLVALFIVVYSPIFNNTPETLGKVLFYALLRVTSEAYLDPASQRRGALIALLFCSLVLLKTSFLPPAVAVVTVFYGMLLLTKMSKSLLKECFCSAFFVPIFLGPWMSASYIVGKTLWFPVLGAGELSDDEIAGFASVWNFLKDGGRLSVVLLGALYTAFLGYRYNVWGKSKPFMLAMPVAAMVLILISQTKFSVYGFRYGHLGAATLFLFYVPFSYKLTLRRWRLVFSQILLQVVVLAVLFTNNSLYTGHNDSLVLYRWFRDGWLVQRLQGASTSQSDSFKLEHESPAYQRSVPDGETLLAFVAWPSFLDFRRNKISVLDWPGMMDPSGELSSGDASSWRRYILNMNIHYVAYSYGNEVGYPDAEITRGLEVFSFSHFQVSLLTHLRSGKQVFSRLKTCTPASYDDGVVVVFDLRSTSEECLYGQAR